MKTGILFDLDGTLLNTLDDLTDAVNYTLRFYGCPERSMDEVRRCVGNGAERLIRLSLPGKDTDPTVEEALATYQVYYGEHSQDKTRPYDGILEALAQIRKEFPIAVVSNKPDRATKPLCKQYFGDDIYALGESEACPRKPAPDMVYQGMAALGVDRCIYVGDSDVDVITATGVGAPCASVLWGFRDEPEIRAAGGTHFCHQVEDLPRLIEKLAENL